MSKVLRSWLIAIAITGTFTQCASIIHGTTQPVEFNSQPSGAKISIDGNYHGNTPHVVPLRRMGRAKGEDKSKKEYAVKIELPGYYPYELKLKRELDGWFFGNLLFGGIIGIIVDASNGAMYKLDPKQVIAQMAAEKTPGASTSVSPEVKEKDRLYIAVTLTPDPSWTKIGTLQKSESK